MANSRKKIRYCLAGIILISLLMAGCVGGAPARGGSGPVVGEGTIYVVSRDGHIFALNPSSRKNKLPFPASGEWVFPTEGQLGLVYTPPLVNAGTVYLGAMVGSAGLLPLQQSSDAKVYMLDAATGQKRRDAISLESSELIIGQPATDKETVFVAAGKQLFALDKSTGKQRWPKPFQAQDRIWADLVLAGDTLYFASLDHRVYAVNSLTGELRWPPFVTEGAIAATPLIVDGTLYIGSFDKGLYALDIASGKPRWTEPFRGGGWFWSRAVKQGGRVYMGNLDGKVYAVDAQTGKPSWSEPFVASSPIRSSPVMVDKTLIVASTNGNIYGLEAETGKMQWPVPYLVGGGVVADLGALEGVVYVYAQDGFLYGLEAATGRPLLTFQLKK